DSKAPANAPSCRLNANAGNIVSASIAPTAAPPDTPSTYGSANGLRNNTCINAPANASKPPTANAASARGTRSCHRISAEGAPQPLLPQITPTVNASRASTSKDRISKGLRFAITLELAPHRYPQLATCLGIDAAR